MAFVVSKTERLLAGGNRIFEEIARCQGKVPVPEFYLGAQVSKSQDFATPESLRMSPLVPIEFDLLSIDEQEFLTELCKRRDKSPEALTDADKVVLASSLENYRQSCRTGHQRMTVGG